VNNLTSLTLNSLDSPITSLIGLKQFKVVVSQSTTTQFKSLTSRTI
jgi:hypothetical protein